MRTKENTIIYQCDYCNKFLQRKHAMKNHEDKCSKNPENINFCGGCKYLIKEESSYTNELNNSLGYSEQSVKCIGFKCSKLNVKLFPRKVLYKGIIDKYPETFEDQMPMPNQNEGCEHFDLGLFD